MLPTGIFKENLVPSTFSVLGKTLSKATLTFLVPVLIFSIFTIPLIFPLKTLLLFDIITLLPNITLDADSALRSVSISLEPSAKIEAITFPFCIKAPFLCLAK